MRIQVLNGENSREITKEANKWLEENEKTVVIISISPAIPKEGGGGYITITYEKVEGIFDEKNLATNS